MSVKIAQASIDENSKAKGGKAGNQSGRELNIRNWWNGSWTNVLRAKDEYKASMIAEAAEALANNKCVGYDQSNRNSLKKELDKLLMEFYLLETDCECDCSSFATVCAECAGIDIPYSNGNAPTTSTMVDAFMTTKAFENLTNEKYIGSSDYLKKGDILRKKGHCVVVISDGSDAEYFIPQYKGTSGSIVDALKAVGYNNAFSYRREIAKKNGITPYLGTARQNTTMLNLLKAGKLRRP